MRRTAFNVNSVEFFIQRRKVARGTLFRPPTQRLLGCFEYRFAFDTMHIASAGAGIGRRVECIAVGRSFRAAFLVIGHCSRGGLLQNDAAGSQTVHDDRLGK